MDWWCSVNRESIVDVEGVVKKVDTPIDSCTQKDVEIAVSRFYCVSAAYVEHWDP